MIKPINFFSQYADIQEDKKVIITFDAPPTTVSIDKAFYKYDKEFAFSLDMDDGLIGQYRVAVPLFNGGNIVYEDGVTSNYPGLFITDGCGNNIPFGATFCINMNNIQPVAGAYMSEFMLRDSYVKGMSLKNHGFSARTQFEAPFWDADPVIRDQQVTYEIKHNYDRLKEVLGIKINNFIAPSHDSTYDPITIQLIQEGYLKFANNINNTQDEPAHYEARTAEYWLSQIPNLVFVGRDFQTWGQSFITRTNSDFDFINTKLSSVGSEHAWFTFGIHNVDLGESSTPSGNQWKYLDFKSLMEGLESNYGASGSDNIWVTSMNNVYEYMISRSTCVVSSVQQGNVVEVNLDFSGVSSEFTEHALSMIVDADTNITDISYVGFQTTSHKVNYKSLGNGHCLINTSYRPPYEAAVFKRLEAQVSVEIAESTKTQVDKDTAQNLVTNLTPGEYKNSLQSRLDAITVIPDSITMQIDFGMDYNGYTLVFPWNEFSSPSVGHLTGATLNNLSSTIGTISNLSLAVTSDFGGRDSNTGAVAEIYPFEATRDCFKTLNNIPAGLQLQNCNASKLYDFTFFSSRGFVGTLTQFTIGGTSVSVNHKDNGSGGSTGNITNLVHINNVVPDGSGNIDISILGIDTGSNKFGHLNVLEITEKPAA
jgi:hypothetical protein